MKIDIGIHGARELAGRHGLREKIAEPGDFSAALAAVTPEQADGKFPVGPPSPTRSYDFRNITPEDLHRAVGDLTKSGQMDLDDSTSLLGIMAPSSALSQVDGFSGGRGYSGAPLNVYSAIQAGIDGATSSTLR